MGAGMSGIVFKKIHLTMIKGGNVYRTKRKAVLTGILFLVGCSIFPIGILYAVVGYYGFFSFMMLMTLLIFGTGFSIGLTHVEKVRRIRLLIIILLAIVLMYTILFRANELLGNGDVVLEEQELQTELVQYAPGYDQVFSDVFPVLSQCLSEEIPYTDCKARIQNILYAIDIPDRTDIYFITKCSTSDSVENICKIFRSGDYKITPVRIVGEKRVFQILQGKQRSVTNNFRMNEIYSTSRYLYDLPSEAEIIVPVTGKSRVIGAVVEVYGD